MKTLELFKQQLKSMQEQIKNKDEEYVRVEALGIEPVAIRSIRDVENPENCALLIHGLDENNIESVLVCPEGHFYAKMAFAPKNKKREPIGFKIENTGEKIL
jgi:hypothetical protein